MKPKNIEIQLKVTSEDIDIATAKAEKLKSLLQDVRQLIKSLATD